MKNTVQSNNIIIINNPFSKKNAIPFYKKGHAFPTSNGVLEIGNINKRNSVLQQELEGKKISEKKKIHQGSRVINFYSKTEKVVKDVLKLALKGFKIGVLAAAAYMATINAGNIYDRITTELEMRFRPETKNVGELIPESNYIISEEQVPSSGNLIKLNQATLQAVKSFTSKLNDTLVKQTGLTGSVTPTLIAIVRDKDNVPVSFKIYCEYSDITNICFEYELKDLDKYDLSEIFESTQLSTVDIINKLQSLATNANLTDVPTMMSRRFVDDNECFLSDVQKKAVPGEWNPDTETYNIENIYTFKNYYVHNNKEKGMEMYEDEMSIEASIAETLENFNPNDLTTLYDIYFSLNKKLFDTTKYAYNLNTPSIIFLSAKQNSQSQEM